MFRIIVAVIFVLGNVSSNDSEPDPGLNLEACDIGDVVENECVKCICSARHLYDCTSKGCSKTNNDSDENDANVKGQSCHPHKIYNLDETICICSPDGSWPHKSCHTILRSLSPTNIIKQKCVPGSYVVIDCNICRCNDKGQIDNERCTKNDCDPVKVSEHRRNSKSEKVFGKCKANNWYSFGPCQFCHCLRNNKLMCNTGAKSPNVVKLGSYNFSVCGADLLKEALELEPDSKEADNVARMNKDTSTPESIKTTTKAADKSNFKTIDLEMGEHNTNNDVDNDDKVKGQYVKAARSKIGKTESQDFSESDEESDKGGEKFTQQPDADSDNRERDSDNSGGRTEDRDDKNDESNSEDGSEESIPIKLTEKEHQKDEPRGSISIKFDMNKAENPSNQEKMPTKKIKKQSKYAGKKKGEHEESIEFDFGNAIKNNLPMMFSSVLSNLRKSVNLDSKNDCEPGTRLQVQCNVCHCLKNKKMICTNNKCE